MLILMQFNGNITEATNNILWLGFIFPLHFYSVWYTWQVKQKAFYNDGGFKKKKKNPT